MQLLAYFFKSLLCTSTLNRQLECYLSPGVFYEKSIYNGLLTSAFIFGNVAAFCNDHSMHLKKAGVPKRSQLIETVEKIYVNLQDVLFQEKNMYANINNHWIPINQIHLDENGYYIVDEWMCGKCGYTKSRGVWSCDNCGTRRDKD